ncbi:hypothetical protein GCM10009799_33000 [Nocardiopsis rhodophaea]|uniref:Uncharacterized protein n=1 Tax=Nocardiopsis rhodophaea TaxID=280238 RepID=A0ABP5ENX0_9ACTN
MSDRTKTVYMDTVADELHLEKPREIQTCETSFNDPNAAVPGRGGSVQLIGSIFKDYE